MADMEFNEVVQPGQEVFDYTRCQRPDGSYYGTSGTCRKGAQVGPKEKAALKKAAAAGNQKAKVALAVVEGKMTKAEAKKELGGGGGEAKAPEATDADRAKAMADLKSKKSAYFKAVESGNYDKAAKLNKEIEKAREKVEALRSPEQKKKVALAEAKRKAEDKAEREAEKARRANAAKRPPKVEISTEARKAINTYTKDQPGPPADFVKMNKHARKGGGDAQTKANIAAFDKALNELPANTGGKSHYRGISASPALAKQMANMKPGDSFSDKGFGSYSRDRNAALAFTRDSKNKVIIESRSKSLRGVERFSNIKSEQEAVLPRGQNQTVREVRKEGNTTYIVVD